MHSLHGFCKKHSLPKTSVRKFLKDRGIDTANGLSDSAESMAYQHFVLNMRPIGSSDAVGTLDSVDLLPRIELSLELLAAKKAINSLEISNQMLELKIQELILRMGAVLERVELLESKGSSGTPQFVASPWEQSA